MFQQICVKLAKTAKIGSGLTFHGLRHTVTIRLADAESYCRYHWPQKHVTNPTVYEYGEPKAFRDSGNSTDRYGLNQNKRG
jgi:integrase